jgi:hypothetical protein
MLRETASKSRLQMVSDCTEIWYRCSLAPSPSYPSAPYPTDYCRARHRRHDSRDSSIDIQRPSSLDQQTGVATASRCQIFSLSSGRELEIGKTTFWWKGTWLVGHRFLMSFDCSEILYSATRKLSLSCPYAAPWNGQGLRSKSAPRSRRRETRRLGEHDVGERLSTTLLWPPGCVVEFGVSEDDVLKVMLGGSRRACRVTVVLYSVVV